MEELLRFYGLETDDAILAEKKHMSIYNEVMKRPDVRYVAGGSGLNTVKMIQWILKNPFSCSFVGCVGEDQMGRRIENECQALGLITEFQVTKKSLETGKVAVLINKKNRSMVTHLGQHVIFLWIILNSHMFGNSWREHIFTILQVM
ncbi:unnamed protein product [Heterobilharzia americana]|nr:unnamed protein product [Heterobilharzia americana]